MPDFRLSETTIAGTPPKKPKARVCEPIQSGRRLRPGRFGVGHSSMRRARRRTAGSHAPRRSPRRSTSHRRAGVVDEQPLAGDMRLPHRRRQPAFPGPIELAEPAAAVTVGMRGAILLPEQLQRHARRRQLAVDRRPVRQRTADPWPWSSGPDRAAPPARRRSGRPAAASRCRPRRARRRQSTTAVAPIPRLAAIWRLGHAGGRQPQHVADLAHG